MLLTTLKHTGRPPPRRLTQPPNISDTKIKTVYILGTSSLVDQWLKLLPMQGTQV